MQEKAIFIKGPAGQLESIISEPDASANNRLAIICHPHPLYDGTMRNKVVTTLAKTFDAMQMPTVRFNYRGVGMSDGSYGQMVGEINDLLAVIDWVDEHYPDYQLWLAGFSFGSYIAASVANIQIEKIKQLVTIAPAVNHADFDQLRDIECPWLLIQGDQDEVVPASQVENFAKARQDKIDFHMMQDCSHFFHGKLVQLRGIILQALNK